MDYRKESLKLHEQWKGKLEVTARAKVNDKDSLSLAYTPGVAQPCLEIEKDYNKSWELTRRWNMVAVITDGSAVLDIRFGQASRAAHAAYAVDFFHGFLTAKIVPVWRKENVAVPPRRLRAAALEQGCF